MASEAPVSEHVHHNIHTIQRFKESAEAQVNKHQRAVERLTTWVSRPASLYMLLALPALWIAFSRLQSAFSYVPFDPAPFPLLQGLVTLYAASAATAVLAAQSRQRREEEQRAQLELQVSLLSEQKATKIISLLEELRRDLPIVENREDLEAEAMGETLDAHAVLAALQEPTFQTPPAPPSDPAASVDRESSPSSQRLLP